MQHDWNGRPEYLSGGIRNPMFRDGFGPVGGGGGSCFSGTTKVSTPSGSADIANLKVGQTVLSWSEAKQEFVGRRVQKVIEHKPRHVAELSYEGGVEPVAITASHTILTLEGWKRAGDLVKSDKLMVSRNGTVVAAAITGVKMRGGKEPVYNLHTEGEHTFIAGGLLAHNYTNLRTIRTLAHQTLEGISSFARRGSRGLVEPAFT